VTGEVVNKYRLLPQSIMMPRKLAETVSYTASAICRSSDLTEFNLKAVDIPAGVQVKVIQSEDKKTFMISLQVEPEPVSGKTFDKLRFEASSGETVEPIELQLVYSRRD
jgi:hypothetical protein